jgi:competence protein ComEC
LAFEAVERFLEVERAQLPPWAVVGLLAGIAAWFALPSRLDWQAALLVAFALTILGFVVIPGRTGRALGWFAFAALFGCALIWARSERVAAPRLDRPMVAEFEARVERVEVRSAKDSLRLTLASLDPALPPRVRVNLPEAQAVPGLGSGARIALRVRLAPPPPGGLARDL